MIGAAPDAHPTIARRIAAMLDGIERDHRVRILLAVESGSRAWGFPSLDSDWDVRFLYVRPLDGYLRVEPQSSVIEAPLADAVDLSGWDVRKGLSLLSGSNAVALEWLDSPIVYRRDAEACAILARLARRAAHLPILAYHYDRLARRHWQPQGPTRFKTLFYVLRPVLALVWIRTHRSPPPMDLHRLMTGLSLPAALLDAIERLRVCKLTATEADMTDIPDPAGAFVAASLAAPSPRPRHWDKTEVLREADAIFRDLALRQVAPGA